MLPRRTLGLAIVFLCFVQPLAGHSHEHYHVRAVDDVGLWLLLATYAQVTIALVWTWLLGKVSMATVVLSLSLTQSVGDVAIESGIAAVEFVLGSSHVDAVEAETPSTETSVRPIRVPIDRLPLAPMGTKPTHLARAPPFRFAS